MAHTVILNGYLSLGGTVISCDVVSMTITHSVDLPEDTAFCDSWKQRLIGVQDYQVAFEAYNDHTDNALDEDLDALMATHFAAAWRPTGDAISASNPEVQFTGAIGTLTKTYAHGAVAKVSGTIMQSTSAGITRDVVA